MVVGPVAHSNHFIRRRRPGNGRARHATEVIDAAHYGRKAGGTAAAPRDGVTEVGRTKVGCCG